MPYAIYISGVLLVAVCSSNAMEADRNAIVLHDIEKNIQDFEKNAAVSALAHYFRTPSAPITEFQFNHEHNALLMINAMLLALKQTNYPVDKLKVSNNTLSVVKPKDYPQDQLALEQKISRSIRDSVQSLDKICRAWNQHTKPNPYDGSPEIPLDEIHEHYKAALNHNRQALYTGNNPSYVAYRMREYFQVLTQHKR